MLFILSCVSAFLFIFFISVWIGYSVFLLLTTPVIFKKFREAQDDNIIQELNTSLSFAITAIIPAFNEAHRIDNTIASILNSTYEKVHIIIVNDGSKDNTLAHLIDTYSLTPIPPAFPQTIATGKVKTYYESTRIPHFLVIDKEHSPFMNSGADCINAGLNACRTPLYLTIDADTILEPDALSYMVLEYLHHPHCVAVGGDLYVPDKKYIKDGRLLQTNIPHNLTLATQAIEYLRSFIYGHEGWTVLGGAFCHPGAFTMLEKSAVMEMGGYDAYNFSYDAEIIMKLHDYMRDKRFPYAIAYAPNAIAWADQPATLKGLWMQRNRWQRGLLRSLHLHIKMLLNPRYGIPGILGFPIFTIYEIVGPALEGCAYVTLIFAVMMHQISLYHLEWLLLFAASFLFIITMACTLINSLTYNRYYRLSDIPRIAYLSLIEIVFYRPFKGLCCLASSVQFYFNRLRKLPL
jgi:biofilm PGA synthesis N-glycosyltransferase PgaC